MKSSFSIHAHLLPHWLDILFIGLVHFWAWRRINQLCSPPLLSRVVFYGIVPSTSLKLGCDPLSPQDPELCPLLVITVKAAPDLYIPEWLFLSMRFRRVLSVFDLQFNCVGMLSLMPSWVVFHTILPLQQISEISSSYVKGSRRAGCPTCQEDCLPADAHRRVSLLFFTLYSSSERHPDVLISQEVYEIFPLMPGGHFSSLRQRRKHK